MSFKFNWGQFPPEFNEEALAMLTKALNKEGGNKPPNLVGRIIAKELDLGSQPPQLDILEISELEQDRFRGMFRMKYEGDGYIVLQTKVQANPLRMPETELPTMPSIGVVAAAQPLVVPMLLRISGLKLHGIIVLAVSKQDGITLVFRSDPLVSVEVHSTFDSVPSVRKMLQREIEATLRNLFQDDLPVIVHEISVNEIRRARERKEKERRECIERQQQQIRQQHARSGTVSGMWTVPALSSASGGASPGSLTNSVSQHLMASQLHQRLVELSRDEGLRRLIADQDEGGQPGHVSRDSLVGKHWDNNPVDEGYAAAQRQQPALYETQSQILGRARAHSAYANNSRRSSLRGASAPALNNVLDGLRMSGDPESLEQFIADDWERYQHAAEVDAYLRQREEQQELESMRNGVVLRPTDNAVAARLASLMTMGQTLSPYTRTFQHTTMRSDVNQRYGQGIVSPTGSRHLGMAGFDPLVATSGGDQYSSMASPPPPQPEFLHRASSHGSRHLSISTFAPSSTPFAATTPPLSTGGRSPFPRNRTLRRKVHKISLSTSQPAAAAD